jgi:hypothetical protein
VGLCKQSLASKLPPRRGVFFGKSLTTDEKEENSAVGVLASGNGTEEFFSVYALVLSIIQSGLDYLPSSSDRSPAKLQRPSGLAPNPTLSPNPRP